MENKHKILVGNTDEECHVGEARFDRKTISKQVLKEGRESVRN